MIISTIIIVVCMAACTAFLAHRIKQAGIHKAEEERPTETLASGNAPTQEELARQMWNLLDYNGGRK